MHHRIFFEILTLIFVDMCGIFYSPIAHLIDSSLSLVILNTILKISVFYKRDILFKSYTSMPIVGYIEKLETKKHSTVVCRTIGSLSI